jgi:hypothetical protein
MENWERSQPLICSQELVDFLSRIPQQGGALFLFKVINKVLYGQNHCLLPKLNRSNLPQQVNTLSAQKSSNLTGKCKRWPDIFG